MKIHKEGRNIILTSLAVTIVVVVACDLLFNPVVTWIVAIIGLLKVAFITSFFRQPQRQLKQDEGTLFSPADGQIVVIEEVEEGEYLKDRRILVSVFMSIWNVHVNWFPVGGKVEYFRHHNGEFMVAWHPKSSEDNERTTTVVTMEDGTKVLFRQIAGMVARRIVSYAKVGERAAQNSQCGFIKFGSRIDIYLPLDADIKVKLNDKVTGTQTVIAKLNNGK